MIQILGIIAITLIGMYMMYLSLFIPASLTFNGKIRLIDKFIGFFNKDYKCMCNEYIKARAKHSELTIDELIKQLENIKSTHPEGGDAAVCFKLTHYLGDNIDIKISTRS